jgi:peptidoglycan/LPS O-acetylase OafA/YrhL
VRGIAALMVFFHHACFTDIDPTQWGRGVRALYLFSSVGMRGVDIFFVLSGFLITSLLIKDRASPSFYQDFYWKRALRILPLYIFCLAATTFLIKHSGAELLLSIFFLANFATVLHVTATGPFWTLAIEEQFYLLWPTVVRRRSVSELTRWALTLGLGAVILRFIAACIGHHNYELTFLRCDGLAAGALLACWYENREISPTPQVRQREQRAIGLLFVVGLICLALRLLVPTTGYGISFDAAVYQTATTLLATGAIAFIIANSGSPMLAIFRSRLLIFFGLISYAMYMTHLYVLLVYNRIVGIVPGGNVAALTRRFFIALGATVLLCLLTRYLIELPAISLRRFVLSKPAPPAEIEEPLLSS